MGITVRRANSGNNRGKFKPNRNWLVIDDVRVMHISGSPDMSGKAIIRSEHYIRTYTCTNWTDAMRVADDLANERTIDPNRIIALSERRV